MLKDEPQKRLNTLAEAAVAQHELYLSWVTAGFTEEQAFELLKAYAVESLRRARGA